MLLLGLRIDLVDRQAGTGAAGKGAGLERGYVDRLGIGMSLKPQQVGPHQGPVRQPDGLVAGLAKEVAAVRRFGPSPGGAHSLGSPLPRRSVSSRMGPSFACGPRRLGQVRLGPADASCLRRLESLMHHLHRGGCQAHSRAEHPID